MKWQRKLGEIFQELYDRARVLDISILSQKLPMVKERRVSTTGMGVKQTKLEQPMVELPEERWMKIRHGPAENECVITATNLGIFLMIALSMDVSLKLLEEV